MRTQMRIVMAACLTLCCSFSIAHAIENSRQKEYHLTEKHGPWMIMVATFRDVRDVGEEKRKKEGLSAEAAAKELVYELRDKGIPAYVFSQDAKTEKIDTFDRLGNKDKRIFAAQRDMVCVLAGNYEKVEDQVAQKTLAYIKRFQPKFMSDPKSGAVVRNAGGGQKGPFGGAFLTINPMRKPTDVVRRKADNETKSLNSGIDFALVNMKKKYSLKVATFTGKSVVPLGSSRYNGREANFEKEITGPSPYNLARAGEDAAQLTYALRQNSNETRRRLGHSRFDAYVYHDKFQSYVAVGGFDSENDPEIKRLAEIFRAKYKSDDKGEYALIGESLSLSGTDAYGLPLQTWAFDPVPELVEVPRIK